MRSPAELMSAAFPRLRTASSSSTRFCSAFGKVIGRCAVAAICIHDNTYSKYSQYAQYKKNAPCCAAMSNMLYLHPDTENISSDPPRFLRSACYPDLESFRRLFKLLCPC